MAERKSNGPVQTVTRSINKRGELKGKDKKETKYLKAICPHHKYNKKGKLKPTIFNNNDGTCICTMCGQKFPTKLYDNDQLGQIVGDMKTLNEQAKYMAVATGSGGNGVDFFAQVGAVLAKYKKSYKKLRTIASKQSHVKEKKRKKNSMGSNQYGTWGSR
jgi:hypothetical protein